MAEWITKSVSSRITGFLYLILLQCVYVRICVCPRPKVYTWGAENKVWVSGLSQNLVKRGYHLSFCVCHFEHAGLAAWKTSGSFSYPYFPSPHRNAGSRAAAYHIWLFMGSKTKLGCEACTTRAWICSATSVAQEQKMSNFCCSVFIAVQSSVFPVYSQKI